MQRHSDASSISWMAAFEFIIKDSLDQNQQKSGTAVNGFMTARQKHSERMAQ